MTNVTNSLVILNNLLIIINSLSVILIYMHLIRSNPTLVIFFRVYIYYTIFALFFYDGFLRNLLSQLRILNSKLPCNSHNVLQLILVNNFLTQEISFKFLFLIYNYNYFILAFCQIYFFILIYFINLFRNYPDIK